MTNGASLNQKCILLGQLGANGDCLNATTIARQIKHDYPDCHLTWAVSSHCRGMVENNPFVDEIWEVFPKAGEAMPALWNRFEQEVQECIRQQQFDEIFLTQIYPNNFQNYDGTTRPSVLRAYPNPISVPLQYTLRLYENEVKNVRKFAEKYDLLSEEPVILFECSSRSGQSFVTPHYALYSAQLLLERYPNCRIILSSNIKIPDFDSRIIDGSELTLRENAELTKYCTLFVGCSSGVTLTALTDWAKPLPMVLLLRSSTSMYASIAHEFEYWGLPVHLVLEMWDAPVETLVDCLESALKEEFSVVRQNFHQELTLDFSYYFQYLDSFLLKRNEPLAKVAKSLGHAVRRYGWHSQLRLFVQTELMPRLESVPTLPKTDEEYTRLLTDIVASDLAIQESARCKICGSGAREFARSTILGKYEITYFQCSHCGFVQTEEPYWLDEAYSHQIARTDVGLVNRNLMMSVPTKLLISTFFNHEGKFLDYGGGYGLFVRVMRDAGFDFYWQDKFCENIFAEGFEIRDSGEAHLELVTAFEVFEHLVDPIEELESLFNFSKNVLFSTELLPAANPKPHQWWYYALEGGQHISIYTPQSLAWIAERFKVNLYSNGSNLHLFTEKELPQDLFEQLQQGHFQLVQKESLIGADYAIAVNNLFSEQSEQSQTIDLSIFSLQAVNWIIFPDWQQPEEELGAVLENVLVAVALSSKGESCTLVLDTTGISAEDANLFLSGIIMSLLMAKDLDITEEIEISLASELSPLQWKALRAQLRGRIKLERENKSAIAFSQCDSLESYNLAEFASPQRDG